MNACAISITRPLEHLVLTQPLGRRLSRGIFAWQLIVFAATFVLGCVYTVHVHAATSKIYALRAAEKRVASLQMETKVLQDGIVLHSSMQAVNARAAQLGFAPIDRFEFVNPASGSYAFFTTAH